MAPLGKFLAEHGMTQATFAALVGAPAALVSQWLAGLRRPGLAYALAIEKATGGAVPAESWVKKRRGPVELPAATPGGE